MNIKKIELKKLNKATYNPRIQLTPQDKEYQNIKKSIETFGYVTPIIINSDYTVIGGHQRLTVMQDLGITEAEVSVLDISKEEEKALNISLNKLKGDWDEERLSEILQELTEQNLADTTGFDEAEINTLFEFMGLTDEEMENPNTEIKDEPKEKEPTDDEPSKAGLLARSFIAPPRTTIDEGAEYMQERREQWGTMAEVRYELMGTWFTPKESSEFYTNDISAEKTLKAMGHKPSLQAKDFAILVADIPDEQELEKAIEYLNENHFICVITEDAPYKSNVRNWKRLAKKKDLNLYNELIIQKEERETSETIPVAQQHRTALVFVKGNITTEQIREWRQLEVKEEEE